MSVSNFLCFSVGYTMSDIRYKWNDGLNSVQVSGDVSLPQFKVRVVSIHYNDGTKTRGDKPF